MVFAGFPSTPIPYSGNGFSSPIAVNSGYPHAGVRSAVATSCPTISAIMSAANALNAPPFPRSPLRVSIVAPLICRPHPVIKSPTLPNQCVDSALGHLSEPCREHEAWKIHWLLHLCTNVVRQFRSTWTTLCLRRFAPSVPASSIGLQRSSIELFPFRQICWNASAWWAIRCKR